MDRNQGEKEPLPKSEMGWRLFAFGISTVIVVGYIVWFLTFEG